MERFDPCGVELFFTLTVGCTHGYSGLASSRPAVRGTIKCILPLPRPNDFAKP